MECKACGVWFVSGDKSGVCHTCKRTLKNMGIDLPYDRLMELVAADRDGRCVVLPSGGHTNKDGENALKSAMNTCFYHNNPVTRYIADAVAEKLTREAAEAALKGDQHGQDL